MQCLAPFEPPDAGPREAAATTRLSWLVVALALSLVAGAAVLLNWRELLDALRRHTVLQAELAVCVGTVAGVLLSRVNGNPFARRRLAQLEQLYERMASLPAPREPGYSHYLPCVLLMADGPEANMAARLRSGSEGQLLKGAVGSILYVGPSGVQFVTAEADPSGRGHTEAGMAPIVALAGDTASNAAQRVYIGTAREVTATPIALPRGHVARVTGVRPRHAVLVRSATGQAIVAIPAIADTLPRLHRCLDELRWGGTGRPSSL